MHGFVPGLLLGGNVGWHLASFGVVVAAAGLCVHHLAGAGRIAAGRGIGLSVRARTAVGLRIALVGCVGGAAAVIRVGVAAIMVTTVVIVLAAAVVIARIGLQTACGTAVARRWWAVVPLPAAFLRLGQAVIGLFHADPVPGLGVGRKLEARVAQEPVGDELGGLLPAPGVAFTASRVMLQRAGQHHPSDRGLDEVRVGASDPVGRIADLASVARQRLADRIRADRKAEREAPEEGLVAQQRGHAVADAAGRLLAGTGGHHAASRSTAGLPK